LFENNDMKYRIIDFLETKGWFSLWILAAIIIGEIGDVLSEGEPFKPLKFLLFVGGFYLFFLLWMVINLLLKFPKEK
jgi:biotin transporter BioY